MSTGIGLATFGYYEGGSVEVAPVEGEIISISEISTRWIPLVAITTCPPENLFVFYRAGNNKFAIYDPTDLFTEFFGDRSTIVDNGNDTLTVTLLPNGGWWQKNFEVRYVVGQEMELAV